ncbi:STAS domain-containing protein [Actinoplanes solisilvae]|uniref:STAS domain-containing protein n=1 Tax=Actinoplanes solisilvae TaxID=2486853 RepID=UPI000FD7CA62|nr:STAS domain-containing protein [Actinoplanes solisilvae]
MPHYSMAGCTVSVRDATAGSVVEVCVSGDLDGDAVPMLTEITNHLAGLSARRVVLELRQLDFAGSALANWIMRLQGRLGSGTPVVVCHPRPTVRWVLRTTGMAELIDDGRSERATADSASTRPRLRLV